MSEQATVWGYYWLNIHKHKALQFFNVLIIGEGFVGQAMKAAIPHADVLSRRHFVGYNPQITKIVEEHGLARVFEVFSLPAVTSHLWSEIVAKYDVVINTVADTDTSTTLVGSRVQQMVDANYTLPITIAKECAAEGILFVNISTACLNIDIRDVRLQHALDFEQAESPYYATKMLADAVLRNMSNVITVRPRLIYDDIDHVPQRVAKNLTWRIQNYPQVYDCQQSVTHRQTLVAAIVHLCLRWLCGEVSDNNVYNVTDRGLVSLQHLTANPNVKIIPCDHSVDSFSPARIVRADNKRLTETGFEPITAIHGVMQAQNSAAAFANIGKGIVEHSSQLDK